MSVCSRRLLQGCVRSMLPRYTAWLQQKRYKTIVMERVFPLPAGKDGGLPSEDQVNELHKILRPVACTYYPHELDCILTDFVEGVGIRGDVVKVKRSVFHEELYPAGLAVYASPDNLAEFEEERKAKGIEKLESRLGVFARMAMKELNHLQLEVPMSGDQEWTLDKTHVQVAFRLQGIELESECIVLPEEPVSEFGEFSLQVNINNLETVTMKATVVPVTDNYVAT